MSILITRNTLDTILFVAVKNGEVNSLRELLKQGANVNALEINIEHPMNTPLHYAAQFGFHDCVYELLEAGANIEAKNHNDLTPLDIAKQNNHEECVQLLENDEEDVSTERFEVETETGETTQENIEGQNEYTPLHTASKNGNAIILSMLLSSGYDKNEVDKYGKKPLDYAVENNHEECVRVLLN
jgi:ankyrin repeat protein